MRDKDLAGSPENGHPADGGSMKSRLLAGLLLVFCCWHAVFLVISVIPMPPARHGSGNPALNLYRTALAGRQDWDFFPTIPALHSMELRLEGVDESGGKLTTGCILPGFEPYPDPENLRYYVLFHLLLLSPDHVAFRDAYCRKANQLLSTHGGLGAGRNWSLVMDAQYTRNLFHSRRDGQLSAPVRKTVDLSNPGGNPP